MTDNKANEIQVSEKQEVSSPAEQTKPGLVFRPNVDIFETDKEITLLADMPGVSADKLDIDLRENTLTLVGEIEETNREDENAIYTEYRTGRYYRQFTLSNVVDQGKIDAALKDGVLRLLLPKIEKATPRQIAIKTG